MELRYLSINWGKNCVRSLRQWVWASTVAILLFGWIITLLDKVVKSYSSDPWESALLKLKYSHCIGLAALWSWENNWGKQLAFLFAVEHMSCQFWFSTSICLLLFPSLIQYLFVTSCFSFFSFHRDVCFHRRLSWKTWWSWRSVYDQHLVWYNFCKSESRYIHFTLFLKRKYFFPR